MYPSDVLNIYLFILLMLINNDRAELINLVKTSFVTMLMNKHMDNLLYTFSWK